MISLKTHKTEKNMASYGNVSDREGKTMISQPYETDKAIDRFPCGECGTTDKVCRIFTDGTITGARWFCYNCAMDKYIPLGWKQVNLDVWV